MNVKMSVAVCRQEHVAAGAAVGRDRDNSPAYVHEERSRRPFPGFIDLGTPRIAEFY
jgi:hypothetical protein